MNLEKVKPAPSVTKETGPAMNSSAAFISAYATFNRPNQPEFSAAAWIAARAGVALATAKAYAELNRFGGAR